MGDLGANLALGFTTALSFQNVFLCFMGCLIGTLVGVLPGVGPIATIAMLLPLTFNFDPTGALIMLAGIYYGAQYGGSTTAILVNMPGEATSVVDALADGGAVWTDSTPNGYASATYLGDRSNGLTVALVLQALRPDENSCGAPDLWLLNCWEVGGVYLFYCHVA